MKTIKKLYNHFFNKIVDENVTMKEGVAILKAPENYVDGMYSIVGTDAVIGIRTIKIVTGIFSRAKKQEVRLVDSDNTRYDVKLLAAIYADKEIDLKDGLTMKEAVESWKAHIERDRKAAALKAKRKAEAEARKAEEERKRKLVEAAVKAEKELTIKGFQKIILEQCGYAEKLQKMMDSMNDRLSARYGFDVSKI